FTIYNRSGEVTVCLRRVKPLQSGLTYDQDQIEALRTFHYYTVESVLRLGKSSLRPELGPEASNGNFVIVPVNTIDGDGHRGIDWAFVQQILDHKVAESGGGSKATTT